VAHSADIGLIGLAVMGQNLVLNMNERGFTVAVYNRTRERTNAFLAGPAAGSRVIGTDSLEELVAALEPPRRVMLMVRAGSVVERIIEQLLPLLSPGDIVIDGGNSLFTDSERRVRQLAEHGVHFIGSGVSGGEEGARHGPSIMPGGARDAWPAVRPILQGIAAQVDGEPCCQWVGDGGSGHYVKMVHNGIEYGDMQLIAEAYHLLGAGLGLDANALHDVFAEWNTGVLDSYLIEITADIFTVRDADGTPLLDKVLDAAGQKGTGKWTGINALELGIPLTLISEAVFARCLSALKDSPGARRTGMLGEHGARAPAAVSARRSMARHPRCAVRLEDHFLRPGLPAHGRRHNASTAGAWISAPSPSCGAAAALFAAASSATSATRTRVTPQLENLLLDEFFRTRDRPRRGRAGGARVARAVDGGHSRTGVQRGAGLLRRLPQRAPAGEPVAGAAGLLRRP
jgi:6-phosphogluconate dehydrogenase (decarboxylating)